MPGPDAYRPGDIITTRDGKTIEVLNTDAEGRIILADAIAHARLDLQALRHPRIFHAHRRGRHGARSSTAPGMFTSEEKLRDAFMPPAKAHRRTGLVDADRRGIQARASNRRSPR